MQRGRPLETQRVNPRWTRVDQAELPLQHCLRWATLREDHPSSVTYAWIRHAQALDPDRAGADGRSRPYMRVEPEAGDAQADQEPFARALTTRQREVVRCIERGLTNEEAARELGISPRTARAHADAIRAKLGVAKRRMIPEALREREAGY